MNIICRIKKIKNKICAKFNCQTLRLMKSLRKFSKSKSFKIMKKNKKMKKIYALKLKDYLKVLTTKRKKACLKY